VRGLRGAAARRRQTCFSIGDVARDCVDPERLSVWTLLSCPVMTCWISAYTRHHDWTLSPNPPAGKLGLYVKWAANGPPR